MLEPHTQHGLVGGQSRGAPSPGCFGQKVEEKCYDGDTACVRNAIALPQMGVSAAGSRWCSRVSVQRSSRASGHLSVNSRATLNTSVRAEGHLEMRKASMGQELTCSGAWLERLREALCAMYSRVVPLKSQI